MSFRLDFQRMQKYAKKLGALEQLATKVYTNQHGSYNREEDVEAYNKAKSYYEDEFERFIEYYSPPKGFWNKLKWLFS